MGRRSLLVFGGVTALLVGLLVVFAIALGGVQGDQRSDVEKNFADGAADSAKLTRALFQAAGSAGAADRAKEYGGDVADAQLGRDAREGNNAYTILLERDGTVVAASPEAPAGIQRRFSAKPQVIRSALSEQGFGLSDFEPAGLGGEVLNYALGFDTPSGRRVLVNALDTDVIYAFLSGYVGQSADVEGEVDYVLDSNFKVLASSDPEVEVTSMVEEPGLAGALAERSSGSYGVGGWFARAQVQGTPWLVVSTAPESTLFESVAGLNQWIPWLILAALAGAVAAALFFLRRSLVSAGRLAGANAVLAERAVELERSNTELEQFASIASHDLREPLRKVRSFVERVQEGDGDALSEKGRDYLKRTANAAGRMDGLIQDLLEFSRVTTRGRGFSDVDLNEIVRDALHDLEASVEQSGARVEVGNLPHVSGDPMQMRQLVQNLISNAIKFRREGVVPEVQIAGRRVDRVAELEVRDNGIGFEQRYSGRIFRIFERLHGSSEYPGTGIGLAMCRKIVGRHGGGISAEGKPGEGAVFTVTIPIEHDEADGATPERPAEPEPAEEGRADA